MQTQDTAQPTPYQRIWGHYILEAVYGFGTMGRSQSLHHSGVKIHRLSGERVVGYVGDWTPGPGQYRIGQIFSMSARCNGNGQHTGRLYPELTRADLNCRSCGAEA